MDFERLADLEKSLQLGQLVYVEISFAVQAGVDMREPPLGIGRTQFLGFTRNQRPIVRTYPLQDILIREGGKQIYSSEGIDFFEKYVIGNDDNEWRKPFEHYRFKLDVKHLTELEIFGKIPADERKRKYIMQNLGLLEKLRKRESGLLAVVVHVDRDDIVQLLAEHPYDSSQAFALLESDLPDGIRQAGHERAIKDITSFYRRFEREDARLPTWENELEFLKKKDVASFIEKFELMPGVTLSTKEFLAGAEEKLKKGKTI
jgi:hypothetical protein